MFCTNCGSKLDDGAKFCGNCGTKVINENNVLSSESGVSDSVSTNDVSSDLSHGFNNYKNIFIILFVCLFVGVLAIIGYCFMLNRRSNIDKIELALNNIFDMSQYRLNVNMDVSAHYEDQLVEFNLSADSLIDISDNLINTNINASTMGISFNIPAYVDINEGIIYLKIPTDDSWYKFLLDNYTDWNIDLFTGHRFVFEDYLRNDEFVERVDSDIKGSDKYILHFTRDILKKLSFDDYNSFDYSLLEEYGFENGFDVLVYVDRKGNFINKLAFDFSGMSFNDVLFDRFIFSIDITDVNNIGKVVIPDDVLSAKDFEIDDFGLLDEYENFNDDYMLNYGDYKIEYQLPYGCQASEINSANFKIYHCDGMRILMSINPDSVDSFFEYVVNEKDGLLELGYTDVALSDIKELSYNEKTFYYKELSYTNTYGIRNSDVYLCYKLGDNYVYALTFEAGYNNSVITEDSIKNFLNFSVYNINEATY